MKSSSSTLKLSIKQLLTLDNEERYRVLYIGLSILSGEDRINTTSKYKIKKSEIDEYED